MVGVSLLRKGCHRPSREQGRDAANHAVEWWKNRPKKRLDESRKRMLLKMLQDRRYEEQWRKLSTLSHVIGTDDDEAKRLLIELGARASSDGQS